MKKGGRRNTDAGPVCQHQYLCTTVSERRGEYTPSRANKCSVAKRTVKVVRTCNTGFINGDLRRQEVKTKISKVEEGKRRTKSGLSSRITEKLRFL